jgi:hypothetical protein
MIVDGYDVGVAGEDDATGFVGPQRADEVCLRAFGVRDQARL